MFKVSGFYQKVHNFLLCRPTISNVLVVEDNLTCNVEGAWPHPPDIKWCHNDTLLKEERCNIHTNALLLYSVKV